MLKTLVVELANWIYDLAEYSVGAFWCVSEEQWTEQDEMDYNDNLYLHNVLRREVMNFAM